jgi:hypothetical protein
MFWENLDWLEGEVQGEKKIYPGCHVFGRLTLRFVPGYL